MNSAFPFSRMEPLSWTGPSDGRIIAATLDEELEEYRLLAYLQRLDNQYRQRKLYPWLDELALRIGQLRALARKAGELGDRLPCEVLGLDWAKQELLRRPLADPGPWAAVEQALGRALPSLVTARERGEELREELNGRIRAEAVGIVPLDAREGWLLLRERDQARIYAYALPLVREVDPPGDHRHVRTRYFATWSLGLSSTYAHIKDRLARTGPLPNPATFAFETDISLPRIETFLPLAKRITYELVRGAAG